MATEPAGGAPAVAGLLLAAGASRRMGRDKLLLAFEGETLLRRAARRALAAGLSPLLVVLGDHAGSARPELADLAATAVVNPDPARGRVSSLRVGLAALPPESPAVVLLLADMPLVEAGMIAELVRRHRESGAPLVASRYGGIAAPPVLYGARLFPELAAIEDGRYVRRMLARHAGDAELVDWPADRLADLDEPADLERLLARRGARDAQ